MYKDTNKIKNYDDIINLPHPTSTKHPRMSIYNRSAQFAPFAALTGYDDAIVETARLTNERVVLDENEKEILDEKLRIISEHLPEQPEVQITFFKEDEKKTGGSYKQLIGYIKKIDSVTHTVKMTDGQIISIEDIYDLQSDLFKNPENFDLL